MKRKLSEGEKKKDKGEKKNQQLKQGERKRKLIGNDDVAAAMIIGGLVSAGASAWNTRKQQETNEKNLAENRALTEETWAREEKSIQTQVADAEAAGLSPLAVIGNGGTSYTAPIPANMQSPNLDASGILSMLSTATMENTKRKQTKAETENVNKQIKKDLDIAQEEFKTRLEIAGIENETKRQQIQAEINNVTRSLEAEAKNLKLVETNKYALQKQEIASKQTADELNRFSNTFGVNLPTRTYTINNKGDEGVYRQHQAVYLKKVAEAITKAKTYADSESEMISKQESSGAGGNMNGGGKNGGFGLQYQTQKGETRSKSQERKTINAQILQAEINKIKAEYWIPIYNYD